MVVILRNPPLNSVRNTEGLRHCVGLALADNHVTALLVDAAVWLATPMSPQLVGGGELKKPLDTLRMLKMAVKVERESLAAWGVDEDDLVGNVEMVSAAQVIDDITNADVVYTF